MNEDQEFNQDYQLAVDYVNSTNRNIYLTGKAGTGKTTFLRYIQTNCHKKLVVAAPTGVAAMNAGGVTLHSLFQLPLAGFVPEASQVGYTSGEFHDRHSLLQHLRLNKTKRSLLRELELLVIDEVSMLRSDILDAIDVILKSVRGQSDSFGGVQVLFIGDLFQLPPVTKNRDWSVLKYHYKSPSFYSAKALFTPPVYIELKKIYRQKEQQFIDILNKVRINEMDENALQVLNSHYAPDFQPSKPGEYITLTTHNVNADVINKEHLQDLSGELFTFDASVTGEFNENTVVAEMALKVKVGAQIMFIRNDKGESPRYYNGKTGVIEKIKSGDIYVSFGDGKDTLKVEKEEWQNVRYRLNEETKEVEEDVKGTFTQFPIRLAWAITIHKSQGLTFDKAIIDAGGSFAPGQVYVALSRLTSLDGLVLKSLINIQGISNDPSAVTFSTLQRSAEVLKESLKNDQKEYVRSILYQAFDYHQLRFEVAEFMSVLPERSVPDKDMTFKLFQKVSSLVIEHMKTADKFKGQLLRLWEEVQNDDYQELETRVEAAVKYFSTGLQQQAIEPVEKYLKGLKLKSRVKKHLTESKMVLDMLQSKVGQLEEASSLAVGLKGEDHLSTVFEKIAKDRLSRRSEKKQSSVKVKRKKGDTQRMTLQMYRDEKTLKEIAEIRGLTESTVHGHLLTFIGTEFELNDLISEEKVNLIMKTLDEHKNASTGELKNVLGDEISYGEISAVVKYLDND